MSTRANTRSTIATEDFGNKIEAILHEHYFEIKWALLYPGDGDFPVAPNADEKASVEKLKLDCCKFAAQELKKVGVLSSKLKRNIVKTTLLRKIDGTVDRIHGYNSFFDDQTRMSRAVVEACVFRALLNGLQKAKLSDGKLGAYDDA
jgi:hypothetical protein